MQTSSINQNDYAEESDQDMVDRYVDLLHTLLCDGFFEDAKVLSYRINDMCGGQ
jgi:hypothetical protein